MESSTWLCQGQLKFDAEAPSDFTSYTEMSRIIGTLHAINNNKIENIIAFANMFSWGLSLETVFIRILIEFSMQNVFTLILGLYWDFPVRLRPQFKSHWYCVSLTISMLIRRKVKKPPGLWKLYLAKPLGRCNQVFWDKITLSKVYDVIHLQWAPAIKQPQSISDPASRFTMTIRCISLYAVPLLLPNMQTSSINTMV